MPEIDDDDDDNEDNDDGDEDNDDYDVLCSCQRISKTIGTRLEADLKKKELQFFKRIFCPIGKIFRQILILECAN